MVLTHTQNYFNYLTMAMCIFYNISSFVSSLPNDFRIIFPAQGKPTWQNTSVHTTLGNNNDSFVVHTNAFVINDPRYDRKLYTTLCFCRDGFHWVQFTLTLRFVELRCICSFVFVCLFVKCSRASLWIAMAALSRKGYGECFQCK